MPNNFNSFNKFFKKEVSRSGDYWIEKVPAWLGNYSGQVEVSDANSLVYARLVNGQVIQVLNTIAPNIYNYAVFVGRDKSEPSIWKVASIRWVYNLKETLAYIMFHHKQHEYPAPDSVFVRRDQFTPLLVLPSGGFNVRLFGDIIYNFGMSHPLRVVNTDIDLSSHAISAGAKYVLLEVLTDGTLNYITGSTYGSRTLLELQPLPTPSIGAFPVCAFEFFEGQTELRRDDIERSIIDLRMFTSNAGDNPTLALLDVTNFNHILSSTDDTIQEAFDKLDDHTHGIGDFPEILTADCEVLFDSDCEILYE